MKPCLNCGARATGPIATNAASTRTSTAPRRFLPRLRARRAPFRGQDLAHVADAGVETGRADPALHRRPAGAVRLADRAVPVLRVPHVRGRWPDRHMPGRRRQAQPDTAGDLAKDSRSRRSSRKTRHPAKAGESTASSTNRWPTLRRRDGRACRPIKDARRRATAVRRASFPAARDSIGKATKNPELLFYKLKTNAYKYSWALIRSRYPSCGCCSRSAGASGSTITRCS